MRPSARAAARPAARCVACTLWVAAGLPLQASAVPAEVHQALCVPGAQAAGTATGPMSGAEPSTRAIEMAIEVARQCHRGLGIGGHRLDYASAKARRLAPTASQPERWSVSIDEVKPSTEPSGRHLIIDLGAGTWSPRTVE